MDHQENNVKKLGVAGRSLIDSVFSWSMKDVLKKNLYKKQVMKIPETFSTVTSYMKSFIPSLVEETHADLLSSMMTLSQAPTCEILAVKTSKGHKPPKDLFYDIIMKGRGEAAGSYEPQAGDLIALTDIRPKCADDLNKPRDSYLIAYVLRGRDNNLSILSSKPINKEGGKKLLAVYLINMMTNVHVWRALNSEGANTNLTKNVLQVQPNSSHVGNSCSICFSKENFSAALSNRWPSMGSDLNDSQEAAVLNCISLSKCTHQNTIKLIWGPPGTGKTKTVAMSLFSLLKLKCRTLTCAPTNIAVLEVAARLLGLVNQSLGCGKYGLGDIILFGNGERMKIDNYDDLVEVFLDYRIEILAECFNPRTGWKHWLESMIDLLEDPQEKYLLYLKEIRERRCDEDGKDSNNLLTTMKREVMTAIINDRNSTKDDEDDFLTLEEFVKEKLSSIGKGLKICMVNLYTHLPTSCISLEVVKAMIRASDLLSSLKALLQDNSMEKIKDTDIRREVVSLLTKLSDGWRQSCKDKGVIVHGGACGQLLEKYKVKGQLNLIWSVDVLEENSDYVQVMKIWDVLPVSDTPEFAERLRIIFRSYTADKMNLCLLRCVEGDKVVPMRSPVDSSSSSCEADPVEILSKPLSSLSLTDEPQTSSSGKSNMSTRSRKKDTGLRSIAAAATTTEELEGVVHP
ncbi:hypothetical protein L3X38_004090 [Prunus dulcis]|uniref:DNA2/NAM7 helicase helicase domain-containing protein n=1 Tax=Prunus dulcis TaxID=3755 RepID=A0AAD5F2V8_PRUDU|nr:hypothetical protein L3X38_004090 [Prunus dulcis]